MNVSARPLSAAAVACAGVVALGSVLPAPAPLTGAAPAVPTVNVESIALAGIGQDIYYAITPWVQYAVSLVEYGVDLVPFIGPPIGDQIYINYFQGIQPIVESTVNYLASVVQNPFNVLAETGAYGDQLYGIGYNYINAQLQFFGLPPLPPAASVPAASAETLTGPGQNLYNQITPLVQELVGGVSYLVNFIPLIGGPIAAQINIGYFQGIQPAVAATVNYLAGLLQNPASFLATTQAYGQALYGIGYDLVSAELRFLGLGELPPRPTAAVPSPRVAAAIEAPTEVVTPEISAPEVAPLKTQRAERRPARTRTETRPVARAAAAMANADTSKAPAKPTRAGRSSEKSGAAN